MLKPLSIFFSLFLFAIIFTGRDLAAQTTNYTAEYQKLHDSINRYFYQKDIGYYREHYPQKNDDRKTSYLWPLCALLEAHQVGGEFLKDFTSFNNTFTIVQKYLSNKPPKPGYDSYAVAYGGGDRFYDDNQWIGITAMNQYKITGKRQWLKTAITIFDFMMTGFDEKTGGGLYWQEGNLKSKNTCSNGPGILLALQLYKATNDKKYLKISVDLYKWVNTHLKSPESLYYDNIHVKDGKIDKRIYSYNTGTMLQSNLQFYEIIKDKLYLKEALAIAASANNYFFGEKGFKDNYWFNAVLLRAFQDLLSYNADKRYIMAMKRAVDFELAQKAEQPFFGKQSHNNLVPQGGMLEILGRLAFLQRKGIIQ